MISKYNSYLLFFFFFQAEDGIRDADVTGVQTCALPISRPREIITLRRSIRAASDISGFRFLIAQLAMPWVRSTPSKREGFSIIVPSTSHSRYGLPFRISVAVVLPALRIGTVIS